MLSTMWGVVAVECWEHDDYPCLDLDPCLVHGLVHGLDPVLDHGLT